MKWKLKKNVEILKVQCPTLLKVYYHPVEKKIALKSQLQRTLNIFPITAEDILSDKLQPPNINHGKGISI